MVSPQNRFVYPSPSFTPLGTDTPPSSSDAPASDAGGASREGLEGGAAMAKGSGESAAEGTEGVMTWRLKHEGVGDVRIRDDEKLWALGGWDHRCAQAGLSGL